MLQIKKITLIIYTRTTPMVSYFFSLTKNWERERERELKRKWWTEGPKRARTARGQKIHIHQFTPPPLPYFDVMWPTTTTTTRPGPTF